MKRELAPGRSVLAVVALCLALYVSAPGPVSPAQPDLSSEARTLLKVVAGIGFTFTHCADNIWPGYDLSTEPYVAYVPGEFVLLLNARHMPAGFMPYPSDWPDPGVAAFVHRGDYRDLAGQFVFDFQIDSTSTFAMGLPRKLLFSFENPLYMLLSSTIHEGFHQYQRHHFGEIPWAREERYPILDVDNTALASLELHVLRDALRAMFDDDRDRMDVSLKEFAAIREHRWQREDGYVRRYEQGQEINEGTARYVEMKALHCLGGLPVREKGSTLLAEAMDELGNISIESLLLEDIDSRLSGLAVAPEDMPRNRIYPVGAALGFLLDRLGIDWKAKFQAAGTGVSYHRLLMDHYGLDPALLGDYLAKAKSTYDYAGILSSAGNSIQEYKESYRQALSQFTGQPGTRVEISLSSKGLRRFRSSKEKKWIVENGGKTLCLGYDLYSLKSLGDRELSLELRDKAVLEENDWEAARKNVVCYVGRVSDLLLDGKAVELTRDLERKFITISIQGDGFQFRADAGGVLLARAGVLTIELQ